MRRLIESGFRFSRKDQQVRRNIISRCTRLRRFLKDNMRVSSTHAGGHHSCSSRSLSGPFLQLSVYVKRAGRKIDFGIGLAEVEARRKLPVLERENRLDHASNSRRRV